MNKIAVLSASLGEFDQTWGHEDQDLPADYFHFTDENFPPRFNSMTPRLQAKIPKMFGWQLKPGYDAYMWIDGNLRLARSLSLQYFYENLENYDIVVLKHPSRDTVFWEYRYNHRGLHNNAPSNYLRERYTNELLDEQIEVIMTDDTYYDDMLVNGGIFMYKNSPMVQKMLKEWWYYVSRYLIMDQLAWAYVLKKSGLKVNVLTDVYDDCPWLEVKRHKVHG